MSIDDLFKQLNVLEKRVRIRFDKSSQPKDWVAHLDKGSMFEYRSIVTEITKRFSGER